MPSLGVIILGLVLQQSSLIIFTLGRPQWKSYKLYTLSLWVLSKTTPSISRNDNSFTLQPTPSYKLFDGMIKIINLKSMDKNI